MNILLRILKLPYARFGVFPQRHKLRLRRIEPNVFKSCLAKELFFKPILFMAVSGAVLLVAVSGSASGQTKTQGNCSSALVSHLLGTSVSVRDPSMLHSRAKDGHVFEQNQMGIASILVLGPDYSEKQL